MRGGRFLRAREGNPQFRTTDGPLPLKGFTWEREDPPGQLQVYRVSGFGESREITQTGPRDKPFVLQGESYTELIDALRAAERQIRPMDPIGAESKPFMAPDGTPDAPYGRRDDFPRVPLTKIDRYGVKQSRGENGMLLPLHQSTPDYPKLDRPEYPQPAFLRYRCGLRGEWETQVHFGGAPRDVPKEQEENYTPARQLPETGQVHDEVFPLFGPDGSPNFAAIRAAFPPPAPKEPG